jgi:hypothetical protein
MTEHDAEEVRRRLLAAVPELPAPPDRLTLVRRRVVRTRTQRLTGAGMALVGVIAAFGYVVNADPLPGSDVAGYGSPSPSGYPLPGWGSAHPQPPQTARPDRPPSGPPTSSSVTTGRPTSCPAVVDLMTVPSATSFPPRGRPWTRVLACRYRHEAFNLASPDGQAARIRGPVTASGSAAAALQSLIEPTVPPASHWASAGCVMPSPFRDMSVDVVFAGDSTGHVSSYLHLRTTCANPEANEPDRPLAEALDALLGPPYQPGT